MKVLKDNYTKASTESPVKIEIKPYPRKHICEECSSELEYEKSDLRMGVLGCMHLDCPCCGYENMIEENEDTITLTVDNVVFPTHFFHTSKEHRAVDCCDNETVKKEIRKGIDFLRKNREEFSWMTAYGNLYIDITRYDGDENYVVFVSNDYYETYIPYADVDYKD